MKYKCEICEKEFKRTEHYNNHLNRKTKCFKKEINKDLQCDKCDKIFTRRDNLLRHEKTKCYKINEPIKSEDNDKSIIKNNTNNATLNNSTVETLNNIINDSSTNVVNHIHINNFNFENTSYITPSVIGDLLKTHGHLANAELVKLKNINPEHKENMNIQFASITNYSNMLFKHNDDWVPIDSKHFLASIDQHSLKFMINSIKDTDVLDKEKYIKQLEELLQIRLDKDEDNKYIIKQNKETIKDALIKHHKTIIKNKKEYKKNKHKLSSIENKKE